MFLFLSTLKHILTSHHKNYVISIFAKAKFVSMILKILLGKIKSLLWFQLFKSPQCKVNCSQALYKQIFVSLLELGVFHFVSVILNPRLHTMFDRQTKHNTYAWTWSLFSTTFLSKYVVKQIFVWNLLQATVNRTQPQARG